MPLSSTIELFALDYLYLITKPNFFSKKPFPLFMDPSNGGHFGMLVNCYCAPGVILQVSRKSEWTRSARHSLGPFTLTLSLWEGPLTTYRPSDQSRRAWDFLTHTHTHALTHTHTRKNSPHKHTIIHVQMHSHTNSPLHTNESTVRLHWALQHLWFAKT